jgi:hypothetical protein
MGELYMAPIVALSIPLFWGMAHLGMALERKGINVPLWAHYYTWMYLMFVYLIGKSFTTMYLDILSPTSWLDPDVTRSFVHDRMIDDARFGENVTSAYSSWQNEASLEGNEHIRWLSISAPVWLIATFATCAYHTWLHVKQIALAKRLGKRGLIDAPLHHKTILILALPLFYGLMSCMSVSRVMQVVIDHVGQTSVHRFANFKQRSAFLLQMYESNFMVGDIYETYALVTFGHLIMTVLKDQFAKHNGAVQQTDLSMKLQASIEGLTVSGVQLFCGTCLIQGSYSLVVTSMGWMGLGDHWFGTDPDNLGYFQQPEMQSYTSAVFQGMGLVSSCAAISNIMTVEGAYEEFLGEFRSSVKFWGTKILVSLAFLQLLVLKLIPPFNTWKETRVHLLYSSLLCVECFAISLLHCIAWGAHETWYNVIDEDDSNKLTNGLLE